MQHLVGLNLLSNKIAVIDVSALPLSLQHIQMKGNPVADDANSLIQQLAAGLPNLRQVDGFEINKGKHAKQAFLYAVSPLLLAIWYCRSCRIFLLWRFHWKSCNYAIQSTFFSPRFVITRIFLNCCSRILLAWSHSCDKAAISRLLEYNFRHWYHWLPSAQIIWYAM